MTANSNWKGELSALLKTHNGVHAWRPKVVSARTREQRGGGLFRLFALLRKLGFQLGPHSLGERHVRALLRYWTADPSYAAHCEACGLTLRQPYSAAYIQQQLSFLRVLCIWIDKKGMIGPAHKYGVEAALVRRHAAATVERGWAANGVDVDTVLAAVAVRSEYVAVQLALMIAFGLRRKEAVMFCPREALVPAQALPQDHGVTAYLQFVRIKRGTKGGRLRFTAVRTELQRRTLARAEAFAGGGHVGKPGLSLQQSLDLFSNTLRAVGVSRRALGITPHGLRHQFASDRYVAFTGCPPPVAGGTLRPDAETLRAAYLEVARELGHNRPEISSAYLGAPGAAGRTENGTLAPRAPGDLPES